MRMPSVRPAMPGFMQQKLRTTSRAPLVNGVQTGEPLVIQTTTSGDDCECPLWFEEYEYARHVLDGSIYDRACHPAIYQSDPKQIESDPEYWKSCEARDAVNPRHEDNCGFWSDSKIEFEMTQSVARREKYADYLNLNVPCVSTGAQRGVDITRPDLPQGFRGGSAVADAPAPAV